MSIPGKNSALATTSFTKTSAVWLFTTGFTWLIIELLSLAGLFVLAEFKNVNFEPFNLQEHQLTVLTSIVERRSQYIEFDSDLGWSIKPGGQGEIYTANQAGLRGDQEYTINPTEGVTRVATFGDSFVHGDDVANYQTWQHHLEKRLPKLEVLNYGVGGYGVDQALLRYRKRGSEYNPGIVLIGFQTENLSRHVNRFRPFYFRQTGLPLAKPRFKMAGDRLTLIPTGLSQAEDYQLLFDDSRQFLDPLGESDYYYASIYYLGPFDFLPSVRVAKLLYTVLAVGTRVPNYIDSVYNPDGEAFIVSRSVIDVFYEDVIANGARPILLLFPNINDIRVFSYKGIVTYQPLLDHIRNRGYEVIDLLPMFAEQIKHTDLGDLSSGHYTGLGNDLVAKEIADYLSCHQKTNECLGG